MSEMIKAYQEINKRRQSNDMDVNSLTMFAEAWNHQQAKIDELQARVDKVVHILTYTNHASTPLCNELRDILKGNKDEN